MDDACRSHRRRVEHDPPARRAASSGRPIVPDRQGEVRLSLGEEIERHGGVSRRARRGRGEGGAQACASARAAQARRVARRLPHRTRPAERERRRARRGAVSGRQAYPVRVLTNEEEGTLAYGGAILTADVELPARIAVCDVGGASTEIAVGSPGTGPRLGRVRRSRLGAAHDARRPRDMRAEAADAFAEPRPADGRCRARGRRQRPRGAPARRPGLGEAELAEALRIVETKLAARGRPALRRRSRARARSSRPASCCSPRCSSGSASRCTSAAAASARAPCSRRSTRSRRRSTLGRPGSRRTTRAAVEHDRRPLLQAAAEHVSTMSPCVHATAPSLAQQLARVVLAAPSASRSSCSILEAERRSTVWTQRTYGLETTRRTPRARKLVASFFGLRAGRARRADAAWSSPSQSSRSPAEAWRSRMTRHGAAPAAAGRARS